MGGTKRIVYVEVLVFYQLGDEGRVVGLFARVEAEVLQQLDPLGTGALVLQQLVQPPADRGDGVLRVRLALGPAQVAAHGELFGSLVEQPREGFDGQPDAQVVGDDLAGHGHVEVAPDQHPLALTAGAGPRVVGAACAQARPTIWARSTRRFE